MECSKVLHAQLEVFQVQTTRFWSGAKSCTHKSKFLQSTKQRAPTVTVAKRGLGALSPLSVRVHSIILSTLEWTYKSARPKIFRTRGRRGTAAHHPPPIGHCLGSFRLTQSSLVEHCLCCSLCDSLQTHFFWLSYVRQCLECTVILRPVGHCLGFPREHGVFVFF